MDKSRISNNSEMNTVILRGKFIFHIGLQVDTFSLDKEEGKGGQSILIIF